jgi:hypothetical protein
MINKVILIDFVVKDGSNIYIEGILRTRLYKTAEG